ncbi:MAG: hypothetical protein ACM31C_06220 [Acidobacteriota bacterium]
MRHSAPGVVLAMMLAACGGSDKPGNNMPDASQQQADAAIDAPSGFVEATHPSQPVAMSSGGPVLASPLIVPVFFSGDSTQQQQLETFLHELASSSYWTAVAQEYGVGSLTIASSVIATETPPTTDSALQTLIQNHAAGTGGWPAATASTIYTVFLPDGVTLTMGGGTSCTDFGGYHSETSANGMQVVYALLPRCTNSMSYDPLQYNTIATSHELLEASTDPHPFTNAAYNNIDDADAIVSLMPGAELGDMCEAVKAAYQPNLVGTYTAQRQWSNASAAAGHDPCVPVLSTPYVEAAANLPTITISPGGQTLMTRGVQIALNASADVEVDLYSDAPAADWTVVAYDVASHYQMQPAELQLTLDRSTGNNGDKLKLTIKRVAAAQTYGISEFVLFSQVNGVNVGQWFGLVSQ